MAYGTGIKHSIELNRLSLMYILLKTGLQKRWIYLFYC